MKHTTEQAIEAFWAKVNKRTDTGCWEWTASRVFPGGYGKFYFKGRLWLAHRLALHFAGVALGANDLACHRCDNRICVNPSHLFVGSAKDNTADMITKGRRNSYKKLNAEKVVTIRTMLAAGVTQRSAGQTFGVTQSCVHAIATGKTWGHV